MGMNRIPIDKSMTKEKAISQGGYYNTDGDWNCIVTLDKYPGKIFRGRVEVLIFKDGKLFMLKKDNNEYRIPGGGFDKGILNKDQAFIETKEEAKMIIHNIRYTGVTYIRKWEDIHPPKEGEIPYDGSYSEVYIADYKSDYIGYIRKGLSDMELTKQGKFYDLDEVKDILTPPHKQALENILNKVVTESADCDDYLFNTALEFKKTIKNLHAQGQCLCIHNRDVESDDGGYVFAEYNASTTEEINEVKGFFKHCADTIQKTMTKFKAYIEEPVSYKGFGMMIIKNYE